MLFYSDKTKIRSFSGYFRNRKTQTYFQKYCKEIKNSLFLFT
ncbi:hypothetical protein BACPLE_00380 [Phocaeicola plebeius DSM 17135]|uniref:Uncharacterized protein n=1 Tax=Phocaeicola plebeius (strain DSM 17135 / JCM 12973 / CCUG 54634 / M2) TaxID=484018 RepID=B5CUK9_PHOPM|nr:hypothetical protein BACPLE_00380 [Phocaeicola plebeius DSM 17135]